jgi:hypothetical protein
MSIASNALVVSDKELTFVVEVEGTECRYSSASLSITATTLSSYSLRNN